MRHVLALYFALLATATVSPHPKESLRKEISIKDDKSVEKAVMLNPKTLPDENQYLEGPPDQGSNGLFSADFPRAPVMGTVSRFMTFQRGISKAKNCPSGPTMFICCPELVQYDSGLRLPGSVCGFVKHLSKDCELDVSMGLDCCPPDLIGPTSCAYAQCRSTKGQTEQKALQGFVCKSQVIR